MSFIVSLESENCLEVTATGKINYISAQKMLGHVIEIVLDKNIVLIFFNFQSYETTISPFETYELFQQAMSYDLRGPLKIGFVHTLIENRMDHYHAENVGLNNGFTIRGFLDENEARDWLFSDNDEIFGPEKEMTGKLSHNQC